MFLASKVLSLLAQPLNWVILLLITSLFCRSTKKNTTVWINSAALALIIILGWEPLPDVFMRRLESNYPEFPLDEDLSGYAGVIVLGGALEAGYVAQDHGHPVLNGSAERMTTAVALARLHPGLRIIFTGGEGDFFGCGPTEAARAKRFFQVMGLPTERLLLEDASRNTYENATLTAGLPSIDTKKRWLLLTSAWHMPRAMGSFEKAGWSVTAYPVDYRTGISTPWTAYSLTRGIETWQTVLHEGLGIVGYRLTGRAS